MRPPAQRAAPRIDVVAERQVEAAQLRLEDAGQERVAVEDAARLRRPGRPGRPRAGFALRRAQVRCAARDSAVHSSRHWAGSPASRAPTKASGGASGSQPVSSPSTGRRT